MEHLGRPRRPETREATKAQRDSKSVRVMDGDRETQESQQIANGTEEWQRFIESRYALLLQVQIRSCIAKLPYPTCIALGVGNY